MQESLPQTLLAQNILKNTVLPPAIMVLGTASNAGKSLLVAGLCRALTRRGLRVAPFKAQNMALNSAVTPDDLEIGRAQALQAQACNLLPDVRMNPVLLKPQSDTGSQVIVMGKSVGHCRVREYEALKPDLFVKACHAYARLAAGRDVMILEGAGSPAEINLKATDIVNARMGREARARVVLAGDIDRGGVFAALVGTLELMDPWERELVVGLVINKFRGDASLLPPALEAVSQRTGKPFLGVLPWLNDLNLPEEDSVGLRSGMVMLRGRARDVPVDCLDVAVLDLAHVGCITDVDPLIREPGLRVRLVSHADQVGTPDLIVIPGSKSTAADLRTMRENGLARAVVNLACQPGGPDILGICGGLQMLGLRIEDPHGLEEASGHVEACLGVLPLVTTMHPEKMLGRAAARDLLLTERLHGYEIHNGRSGLAPEIQAGSRSAREHRAPWPVVPWMTTGEDRLIGWTTDSAPDGAPGRGRVWATYAHGLFDDDAYRCSFLNALRRRRGKPECAASRFSLEPGLNKLADAVEKHLDVDKMLAG